VVSTTFNTSTSTVTVFTTTYNTSRTTTFNTSTITTTTYTTTFPTSRTTTFATSRSTTTVYTTTFSTSRTTTTTFATSRSTTTVYGTSTVYVTTFSTGVVTSKSTTTTFGTSRSTTTTFNTSRTTTYVTSRNTYKNTSRVTSKGTSRTTTKGTSRGTSRVTSRSTSRSTSTTSSLTSFGSTGLSNFNFVCNEFISNTYYGSNVSSGLPQTSSFVYTNSSGTASPSDGWYGASNVAGFSPSHRYRISGGAGGVISLDACGGGGFSDRRLKKDIKLIGVSSNGINIYSFKFKDEKYGKGLWQGVMADEIEHIDGAVINFNGYKWVHYTMKEIDVEFKQI
tara:strand:- start:2008 stop:3018 length:1011 start_codon:yes stop_codon:yes gene_type:complete